MLDASARYAGLQCVREHRMMPDAWLPFNPLIQSGAHGSGFPGIFCADKERRAQPEYFSSLLREEQ